MMPFQITDWSSIGGVEYKGCTGAAVVRTLDFGDLKIRQIHYSATYEADHWCEKGHIACCVEGELSIELKDGSIHVLRKGMSFQVSDDASSHKARCAKGAALFIIDGEFLKS